MAIGTATALFQVFDMNASVAFYRDALGFELIDHSPEIEASEGRYFHWCWLRRDAANIMLNTAYEANERPAAPDTARREAHRDTCLYINCDDVDALHTELAGRGVDSRAPKDAPYGMRQLYVGDPDGFQLCFQHRVTS